jgi:hypothetical protein
MRERRPTESRLGEELCDGGNKQAVCQAEVTVSGETKVIYSEGASGTVSRGRHDEATLILQAGLIKMARRLSRAASRVR